MPAKRDPKKKLSSGTVASNNILNFFKKVNESTEKPQNCIDLNDSDDDIIPKSPDKSLVVLKNVTNQYPAHSTQIESNFSSKRRGSYPDDIPDMEVEMPQRKKPCTLKEGIKVLSLADISQEEFKSFQEDGGKSLNHSLKEMTTPDKKTTPRKNRSSGKKKTPNKLFHQSPEKAKDFKVEIINNFVKITPSKNGQIGWVDLKSPVKSAEKKEVESPINNRSEHAKSINETTPVNKPSHSGSTPISGKARVKLDFTLSNTFTTVLPNSKLKNSKTPVKSPFKINGNDFFEDSWDEQLLASTEYTLDLSIPQHCKIIDISKAHCKVTISVQSTKSDERAVCYLSSLWIHTPLKIGAVVYIQAHLESKDWIIDNNHGILVLEPDYLVSSTTLVGAVFCKRKCVLKERFGGFDPSNKIMIVGSLVHTLLQESLKRNLHTVDAITTVAHQLLTSRNSIKDMFESSLTVHEIEEEIRKFIPRIQWFMQQYLSSHTGKFPKMVNKEDWQGKIDNILDIEENIWCTELGIKGKIDVSVNVGDSIMPLELKTGRASMSLEHRGQVILYIMMMNKLGYKVSSGLLLYLREGVLRNLPITNNEKRDLIIMRNEIVHYLTLQPQISKANGSNSTNKTICDIEDLVSAKLPPPINHHSACTRCEFNDVCSIYLQKENYNLDEYKLLRDLQPTIIGHLSQNHINYFHHWCDLLALEGNVVTGKPVRDIYLKSPDDREKLGRCLTNMKLFGDVSECNGVFSTTFEKDCENPNLLVAEIHESDYVIVSSKKRPAIASGIVSYVDYKSITIELDRDLSRKYSGTLFVLDTYDSNSSNLFNFTNLTLLLRNDQRATKLRRHIIDQEPATFETRLPKLFLGKTSGILKNMNSMQQKAIVRAIAARDYLLIKGMPGTGKTATIVALVRVMVETNYSVLITSHTHSAVDNVCLRLLECGVKILRLGAESRIHPSLKKVSEHYLTRNCKTPDELSEVYNNANVLAVTCLGSKHPLLSKRTLDYCIVDESTQVLQCSVIRALHSTTKFILVGDPDQLPPVVRNKDAVTRGMSESLFDRLQKRPEAIVALQFNYRMNKTITALANSLTYNGELLIANDKVANANLRLPKLESMTAIYNDHQWLLNALNDELEKAVFVLDTGPVWNNNFNLPQAIEKDENRCVNPSETAIVVTLVNALLKGGVSGSNIGVISPFRTQVAQITEFLQSTGIDVSTVDQFQGKDKEVIIYSCVKSRDISKPKQVSKTEIMEDQRRLTVAITRAKHKLILIADVGTVREYSPFAKLFSFIDSDSYLQLIDGSLGFKWEQLKTDCQKYKL